MESRHVSDLLTKKSKFTEQNFKLSRFRRLYRKKAEMREGKIEDILVLTEEEENTPLFVTPRARRDVQVKKSSYQGKNS